MNRDRLRDRYAGVKPNFYCISDNRIIILWARKNHITGTYIVSAILSPFGPYSFRTHTPTHHKGTYLFRKHQKRIYINDLIEFPDDFFDAEKGKIIYSKFLEKHPGLRFTVKDA